MRPLLLTVEVVMDTDKEDMGTEEEVTDTVEEVTGKYF